jgi:hypothetical protein
MQQVERWGSQQQLAAITLQVYRHNQAASISTSGPISPCKATGCTNPSAPLAWQNQKIMKFCE